jgi:hypothetical protein
MNKIFRYIIVYISMIILITIGTLIAQSISMGNEFFTSMVIAIVVTGCMVPIIVLTKFAS